jgi:hypothetical protein
MADAPRFITTSRYPSLYDVVGHWAPEIGWQVGTLRRAAMDRLWHCSKEDHETRRRGPGMCCGRMVSVLGRGDMPACQHFLSWAELGDDISDLALKDAASREVACDPDLLA